MAVKFSIGNTTEYYTAADAAALTFPDGPFALGMWVQGDSWAGTGAQYPFSTGSFGANGAHNVYMGEDDLAGAVVENAWGWFPKDDDGTDYQASGGGGNLMASGTYPAPTGPLLLVFQRTTADNFEVWVTPAGAAANLELQAAVPAAYDASDGGTWNLGRRADGVSTRYYEQHLGEVFFLAGADLAEADITELASGLVTIADVADSEAIEAYWPLADADDVSDASGNGHTLTKNGTPATSTVQFVAPVAVTEPAARRVFQRDGSDEADIGLSGSYSGADPNDIQARVLDARDGTTVVADWTTLTGSTIGSGAWSGTLAAVPAGNDTGTPFMYLVQVRSRDADPAVLGTSPLGSNPWGVGDVIAVHGSSSADKWQSQGTGSPQDYTGVYYSGAWRAPAGTGGVAFANTAAAGLGNPVGMVNSGVGGTQWTNWDGDGDAAYGDAEDDITAAGGAIAGAVVIGLGYNDASNNNVSSDSYYADKAALYAALIRAHVSAAGLPIFLSGPQRGLVEGNDSDGQWNRVRVGWGTAIDAANVYGVAPSVDLPIGGDDVHLTDAGYATQGERAALAVLDVLGSAGYHRGPLAASAAAVDFTAVDVTLTHAGGDDFTPTEDIAGFEVSDDNFATTLAVSAAVQQDATTIRLTHAAAAAQRQVRYGYGADAFGDNAATGAVIDNAAAISAGLPLEPTLADIEVAGEDFSSLVTAAGGGDVRGNVY